jgi:hypothetical protein
VNEGLKRSFANADEGGLGEGDDFGVGIVAGFFEGGNGLARGGAHVAEGFEGDGDVSARIGSFANVVSSRK